MPKTVQERTFFRKLRTRNHIFGTSERPRLSVYRSLKHIYAQVIDDTKGHTLASASTLDPGLKEVKKKAKQQTSAAVGELVAQRALKAGVKKIVFDRGARIYHGRIKAMAEAARAAGLEF